jgi:hypothetical protein
MKKFAGAWEVRGGVNGVQGSNMVEKDMEGNPKKKAGGDKLIVTVGRGTVNGFEPIVNGKPISGTGADGRLMQGGQPEIVGLLEFDKYYRCYVCIKIRVEFIELGGGVVVGKMPIPPSEEDLTIVISKGTRQAHSFGNEYWLHPIATISKMGVLAQVGSFDYLHYTGNAGRFHYFAAL